MLGLETVSGAAHVQHQAPWGLDVIGTLPNANDTITADCERIMSPYVLNLHVPLEDRSSTRLGVRVKGAHPACGTAPSSPPDYRQLLEVGVWPSLGVAEVTAPGSWTDSYNEVLCSLFLCHHPGPPLQLPIS